MRKKSYFGVFLIISHTDHNMYNELKISKYIRDSVYFPVVRGVIVKEVTPD